VEPSDGEKWHEACARCHPDLPNTVLLAQRAELYGDSQPLYPDLSISFEDDNDMSRIELPDDVVRYKDLLKMAFRPVPNLYRHPSSSLGDSEL
jgi:hypothetical protein